MLSMESRLRLGGEESGKSGATAVGWAHTIASVAIFSSASLDSMHPGQETRPLFLKTLANYFMGLCFSICSRLTHEVMVRDEHAPPEPVGTLV